MADTLLLRPVFSGVLIADRAELEEHPFVLSVAPLRRGGEAVYIGGGHFAQHFLISFSSGMMAFIHNDKAVVF